MLLGRRLFEADEDAGHELPHEPPVLGLPEVEQRVAELRLRRLIEVPREEDGVRGDRPLLLDDPRAGEDVTVQRLRDVAANTREAAGARIAALVWRRRDRRAVISHDRSVRA